MPKAVQRLADLPPTRDRNVSFQPDAEGRAAMAAALDLPEVRKLRLEGRLSPQGKRDWRLEAMLGATVIQTCGVTLAPVTTRIDEPVVRTYMAHPPEAEAEAGEVEMPGDTDIEPLPEAIDLAQIALEAVALALPPFPRAAGADPGDMVYTEPGQAPMTDENARPFAGLAALKRRLDENPDEDPDRDG